MRLETWFFLVLTMVFYTVESQTRFIPKLLHPLCCVALDKLPNLSVLAFLTDKLGIMLLACPQTVSMS